MGEEDFGPYSMQIFIRNAGVSRDRFYGATKETAKKIGLKYSKKKR